MAPVTAILFGYRLPSLDAKEFRDYIEEVHTPLTKSLLGPSYPLSHTRYYTSKDPVLTVGEPSSDDVDIIEVITFESQGAMQAFSTALRVDGVREKIMADEAKFTDRYKLIVLGEEDVAKTTRD